MNITNTVENRVLQILKDCPETRNDDMLLFSGTTTVSGVSAQADCRFRI